MRISVTLLALCCLVVVSAAKKTHEAKKYSKEHQKPHHLDHKKHEEELLVNEAEPRAKSAPVEVPEPEIELQENLEVSKKTDEKQQKDLHLQDLTYEENLPKEKKHHRAEADKKKAEKKLFADQESKHSVDEKVIEDSFEPLDPEPLVAEKPKDKKRKEEKKNKDKSKGKKKAHEKSKDKKHKEGKKSKDGKKHKKDKKY